MKDDYNLILIMEEDKEQMEDLPAGEYLVWLKGMADKYPKVPYYHNRLRNERAYQDAAYELFPDDEYRGTYHESNL